MKTYTVIISATARDDIESISGYIIEKYGDHFNAKKVTDKILARCSRLAVFPKASSVKLVFMNKKFRFARAGKYVAVYYIDEKNAKINVSRIIYSRRDILSIIKNTSN